MASGKPGDTTRLNTDEPSVERHFEGVEVLEWNKQLTIRVFFVCLFIGFFTTIILMRLNIIAAFVLNSAIPPYLLSLFLLKTWTIFLDTIGILKNPITRQESVVMHSCLVGFFSIVYYGNFYFFIKLFFVWFYNFLLIEWINHNLFNKKNYEIFNLMFFLNLTWSVYIFV